MPIVAAVLVRVFRGKEVEIRLAQDRGQRPADRLAEPLIGRHDPAVQVLAKDIQRQAFDQRLVFRARGQQGLLGPLAVGDFPLSCPESQRLWNNPWIRFHIEPSPHGSRVDLRDLACDVSAP